MLNSLVRGSVAFLARTWARTSTASQLDWSNTTPLFTVRNIDIYTALTNSVPPSMTQHYLLQTYKSFRHLSRNPLFDFFKDRLHSTLTCVKAISYVSYKKKRETEREQLRDESRLLEETINDNCVQQFGKNKSTSTGNWKQGNGRNNNKIKSEIVTGGG